MAVCKVAASTKQPEPASRLKSATRDACFLRNDSRCQRYKKVLSNVTTRYLGSEQIGSVSSFEVDFQLTFSLSVVEIRIC